MATFSFLGKVGFGQIVLSKLLPLVIAVPLFFSLQTFFPELKITFDFEVAAYVLAIGIIVIVSAFEGRVSQGGEVGFKGLNLGSGISYIIMLTGMAFLVFILGFQYDFNNPEINVWISYFLGFSILILGIQAIRDIPVALKQVRV